MFGEDVEKRKECLYNRNMSNQEEEGDFIMIQVEQALTEAIGEGYRVVITNHAEYNLLFFDEDEVVFVSRRYIDDFCRQNVVKTQKIKL